MARLFRVRRAPGRKRTVEADVAFSRPPSQFKQIVRVLQRCSPNDPPIPTNPLTTPTERSSPERMPESPTPATAVPAEGDAEVVVEAEGEVGAEEVVVDVAVVEEHPAATSRLVFFDNYELAKQLINCVMHQTPPPELAN